MDTARAEFLLLRCAQVDESSPSAVTELLKSAASGELRDVDFTLPSFTLALRTALTRTWQLCGPEDNVFVDAMHELVSRIQAFPEFTTGITDDFNDDSDDGNRNESAGSSNTSVAASVLTRQVGLEALRRSGRLNDRADEAGVLSWAIHGAYAYADATSRSWLRPRIVAPLRRAAGLGDKARSVVTQVAMLLRVIGALVRGFKEPLANVDIDMFMQVILPLHSMPGKVSAQEPVLGLIHEPLMFCVTSFLVHNPSLAVPLLAYLLDTWPPESAGNSPKQVLFMHELETVLEHMPTDTFMSLMAQSNKVSVSNNKSRGSVHSLGGKLSRRIACGLGSSHSTVCQRTLQMWKNEVVCGLLVQVADDILPFIVDPLLNQAHKHWNKTAVAMSELVLKAYFYAGTETEESLFRACEPVMRREALVALIQDIEQRAIAEQKNHEQDPSVVARTRTDVSVPRKDELVGLMNMVNVKVLGEGSFGEVIHALKVVKGKPRSKWLDYAVKRMPLHLLHVAEREAAMMDMVAHPNCTRLIAMYRTTHYVHLVIEYAANGDLHEWLARNGAMDVDSARFIGAEIGDALNALHLASVVFGDLKPENVLVHANGHCKLGDFGAARLVEECGPGAPMEGTMVYLAPEAIRGKTTGFPMDWWAFGCVLYQMMVGRPPIWADEDETDHDTAVMSTIVHFSGMDQDRFPADLDASAIDIISQLLTLDLDTRLGSSGGAAQVEAHPFFSSAAAGYKWKDAHALAAPKLVAAPLSSSQSRQPKWTQRSYSMMLSPLPQRYTFDSDAFECAAVVEGDEAESPWDATATAAAVGGRGRGRRGRNITPVMGLISESSDGVGGEGGVGAGGDKSTDVSAASTAAADSLAMPPPSFVATPFLSTSRAKFTPVTVMPGNVSVKKASGNGTINTSSSTDTRNNSSSDSSNVAPGIVNSGHSRTRMTAIPALSNSGGSTKKRSSGEAPACVTAAAIGHGQISVSRGQQQQQQSPAGHYTVKGMDLSAG